MRIVVNRDRSTKKRGLAQVASEANRHHLIGNALCLNFANTLYGHGATPVHEYLFGYTDLLVWSCRRAGVIGEDEAEQLLDVAERRPKDAQAVFKRAIALRETIYRVFAALAHEIEPTKQDILALNDARAQALAHSRVGRADHRFVVEWDNPVALERMLWPIALAATELLTSNDLARVHQCAGCDWLFLDTSRNHMRRWCQMQACGNRAKVRRFLLRQRKLRG